MKKISQNNRARVLSENTEKSGLDSAARELLIEKHAHLIHFIARRIHSRLPVSVELNELVNAGVIGLIDALNKYDVGKNIDFKTYAEYRIRGAILDELRSVDWRPRSVRRKIQQLEEAFHFLEQKHGRAAEDSEVAAFLNLDMEAYYSLLHDARGISLLSLSDVGAESEEAENILQFEQNPYLKCKLKEIKDITARAIKELPEKERLVITLYYYEEMNMKDIADALDLSESRISQLHTKAKIRLRKKLKEVYG